MRFTFQSEEGTKCQIIQTEGAIISVMKSGVIRKFSRE